MFRYLLVTISLALGAQLVLAAEAGKVIFVAGKAQLADRPLAEGAAVQEGDMLTTGADGFIYVKTIDNGLFILRPNTKARIVAYHIDAKNPANTRIKLDLISGIARSRSGEAVKQARQNFRFNTPVAAIGVRGTDFTVFTDSDTSRVAVISGGIVVSGFGGTCNAEGIGPCEGTASRELSATQRGQLLQVRRGQVAPQLMQGGALAPDQMAPPRGDEPRASIGGGGGPAGTVAEQPNLDASKGESLSQVTEQIANGPTPVTPPPVVMPPPVTPDPDPLPVPTPPVVDNRPESGIVWGRWQRLLGRTAKINLVKEQEKSTLVAVNGNFALFRTPGKDYVAPEKGKIGFAMQSSEAFIYSDYGDNRIVAPATLTNGKLNVDFGSKTFTTSVDLLNRNAEVFGLSAQGTLTSDGRLHGDASNSKVGYIDVQGLLSNQDGGSAAYIFSGKLDNLRTVNGVTYWGK